MKGRSTMQTETQHWKCTPPGIRSRRITNAGSGCRSAGEVMNNDTNEYEAAEIITTMIVNGIL